MAPFFTSRPCTVFLNYTNCGYLNRLELLWLKILKIFWHRPHLITLLQLRKYLWCKQDLRISNQFRFLSIIQNRILQRFDILVLNMLFQSDIFNSIDDIGLGTFGCLDCHRMQHVEIANHRHFWKLCLRIKAKLFHYLPLFQCHHFQKFIFHLFFSLPNWMDNDCFLIY